MSHPTVWPQHPLNVPNPYTTVQYAAAQLLDPFSTRRIRGLLDLRGRRCLDVSAGGGVAGWLAEQVGPAGYVLATGPDPGRMPRHPNLRVTAQDLTGDQPLGDGWDVIHARLTLAHLPPRRHILGRLAEALKPGGILLVEDWETSPVDMVMDAPTPQAATRYRHYRQTLAGLFAAAGTDHGWARHIHAAMVAAGLCAVDTVIHATAWTAGSPGTRLVAATLAQMRDQLVAAGMTPNQLADITGLLEDPRLILAGYPLYSTSGQRPTTAPRPAADPPVTIHGRGPVSAWPPATAGGQPQGRCRT